MSEGEVDVSPTVREAARRLSEPGILSYKQAVAYVLRRVERVPRAESADALGCSESNLDTLVRRAETNIKSARTTLDRVDDLTE